MFTVERSGRRSYIRGETFGVKDALKGAGAKWDPDARAWWIGDHEKAVALAAGLANKPATAKPAGPSGVRYVKLESGAWGVAGKGLAVGQTVTVRKKDGTSNTEKIREIIGLPDHDGVQVATIEARAKSAGQTSYSYSGSSRYGRRSCKTGGNCSSFGSGRSCGADDCDGY